MPITAKTITDDQIQELRKGYLAERNITGVDTCDVALGRHGASRNPKRVARARARCAEILNRRSQAHAKKKTPAQLDAEIAEALSESGRHTRSQRQQMSRLRPVEGLRIPADARGELIRFWRAHPALRKGCLGKYGFDPIDEEAAYWRFGLAEPDHADVLRAVRRNGSIFSLAHVKRWEIEELRG